jgi:dephospho-CoA kinase
LTIKYYLRGIASGKSTIANIFKEKQIPVIDADVFARLSKNNIIKNSLVCLKVVFC